MIRPQLIWQANRTLEFISVTELVQTSSVRATRQIFKVILRVKLLIQGRQATNSCWERLLFPVSLTGWRVTWDTCALGTSMTMFPEKLNWGGKIHLECSHGIPQPEILDLTKRGQRVEKQNSFVCFPMANITWTMSHAPVTTPSPPW